MMALGSAPYVVTFSSGFLIEILDYCFYAFRNLKIHPLSFSMLSFTEFLSLFLTTSFRSSDAVFCWKFYICEYRWLLLCDTDFPGQNRIESEKCFQADDDAYNEAPCLCINKMHIGSIQLAFQFFNTSVCVQPRHVCQFLS